MKKILLIVFCVAFAKSNAQIMPLTLEPDGGNLKASVSEQIGIVKISITYSRPGVKGREGKIWGTTIAHYGFKDLGHGTSTAAPWRAGANENTVFTCSHPIKVEGKDLPAGSYGFFIALGEEESTIIFSKIFTSWGSFYYDASQDALRVTVKNKTLDKSVEWLRYEFMDETKSSTAVALSWEKRLIPFRIEADVQRLQIEAFKNDLRTTRNYFDFVTAAQYCLENNIELEQALAWIDRGTYFRIMGQKNFLTLSTRATLLRKLNRIDEAKKAMDTALPYGAMLEVHGYARELLNAKDVQEAFKIFKYNYAKNPKEFATNVGMGRIYSATGDYKKALQFMNAAIPLAPDETSKARAQAMADKLKEGKDVN